MHLPALPSDPLWREMGQKSVPLCVQALQWAGDTPGGGAVLALGLTISGCLDTPGTGWEVAPPAFPSPP